MALGRRLLWSLLGAGCLACTAYQPFDSAGDLRSKMAVRLGEERARSVPVPFHLEPEVLGLLAERLPPTPSDVRAVDQVLDFIFGRLDLRYALYPTRDAMQTFHARQGNCLSFVNLFVAVARHARLAPFYVEVTDYQRWNYRDGTVVSHGHIVAGMYVQGTLRTFDFLPYRPKSYKSFRPIDDLAAAAHYFNNLGGEALMRGNLERAREMLTLAHELVPQAVKPTNNLAVLLARTGELERAEELLREGLETAPQDVALLTNLAGLHLRRGQAAEALALMEKIEGKNNTNPYFFLHRGEVALAQGDTDAALRFMVEALRRDSEAPEVHLGLVKLHLAVGDLERARHHLGRALHLDATSAEARRYAEMLAVPGAAAAGGQTPQRP